MIFRLLLIAFATSLIACSPRAYYRTLETGTGSSTSPVNANTETEPNLVSYPTHPGEANSSTPSSQESTSVALDSRHAMSWDEFSANVIKAYHDKESAWAAIETKWTETLFELRASDPLFAPRSEFETESAFRDRQGQALARIQQNKEEAFTQLEAEKKQWRTRTWTVQGVLTLNPEDYDANTQLWRYRLTAGPDPVGLYRKGWWAVNPEEAEVWSTQNPSTKQDILLEVIWTRSGTPQIVRAYTNRLELIPQGATRPILEEVYNTQSGWTWQDDGLLVAGYPETSHHPWNESKAETLVAVETPYPYRLSQSLSGNVLVTHKIIQSRGTWNADRRPEPLRFAVDGMEFNVPGWREIHALDVRDDGRIAVISGAGLVQSKDQFRGYYQWGVSVVDPITGTLHRIGPLGSNSNDYISPIAHDVCLHPSESLVCTTTLRNTNAEARGVFTWEKERSGVAKKSADIPAWATRASQDIQGEHLLLHDFSGRVQLMTFTRKPRKLSEWRCGQTLIEAIPAFDGKHVITLESSHTGTNSTNVVHNQARLTIRKSSNGMVIWATPFFAIRPPDSEYADFLVDRMKIYGRECVVTGVNDAAAALFLLPIDFGTP
jgi:hypothetical protein